MMANVQFEVAAVDALRGGPLGARELAERLGEWDIQFDDYAPDFLSTLHYMARAGIVRISQGDDGGPRIFLADAP